MVNLPVTDHDVAVTTNNDSSSDVVQSQQQQQQQHVDDVDDHVDKEKKKKKKIDDCNDSNRNSTNIIINKTRVRDTLGYVGTVVYIGPVASAKDESIVYAGILWDDPTRGKHNGTVVCRRTKRLIRHFGSSQDHNIGPAAASFIKLSKLDTGRLLTPNLIQERYVPLDSDECIAPNEILPHTAQTASGANNKPIEFLGEYQIRKHLQIQQLHYLSLRRFGINGIDQNTKNVNDWSSLFHQQSQQQQQDDNTTNVVKLTYLDLAGNLLSDWQSVNEILNVMTIRAGAALDTLNLSWNRLGDLESFSSFSSSGSHVLSTNTTLTTVNLQACYIQNLETIIDLGCSWTRLQELGLAKCNFVNICCCKKDESSLSLTTTTSTTMSTLSSSSSRRRLMNESQQETCADNNNVDSDSNIQRDDDCNSSSKDNINNHEVYACKIDIGMVQLYQQQLTQHLSHLKRLDLSSCQLHSPYQVVVLAQLPVLESFSLDDNPLQQLPCRTCDTNVNSGDGDNASPTTQHGCCLFPALQHLQLAGTKIADWTSGLDDFLLGCRYCRAKRAMNNEDSKTSSPAAAPPGLQSLRFRSTPLSERLGAAATRVTLIARYGSSYMATPAGPSSEAQHHQPLSVINATVVTDAERIQAERRYVTSMCRLLAQQERDAKLELQSNSQNGSNDNGVVVDDDKQMKKIQELFWQEHPMLPLLLERHQTAAACGSGGGSSGAAGIGGRFGGGVLLADSIISVSLQSMAASSCEKPPLIRRLPLTLTILQVKTMLARHFGLDVDLQQLSFVVATTTTANDASNGEQNIARSSMKNTASSTGLLPTIMDDDEATLGYFGVDDGAVIYMHEIDVTERQLQQTREKVEFDMKLQQQQADWEARLGAEKKEQQ